MSTKYPGGIISKTAPVPAGPFANGAAPGIWTLEQQAAYVKQGIWPIAGNIDPSAFIENLFSTYLYDGTGASRSITNGIDLSTKGGLVWIKNRFNTGGTYTASHILYDTVRGMTSGSSPRLISETTDAQVAQSNTVIAGTTGFDLGSTATGAMINGTGNSYVSWTFREQPKFFDVVTYSGTGSATTIPHNLGSVPGCIIVKRTNTDGFDWFVYHRSTGNTNRLLLNDTASAASGTSFWNDTTPTSTVFTVGSNVNVNQSGGSYVAYLFAHDAGGFGLTGTDNVITCGSFTTDGSAAATVSLGYEPQWVLFKRTDSSANGDWNLFDNMRGLPATGTGSTAARLKPNTSGAEAVAGDIKITSTGFVIDYVPSASFIYIAIRRGPMAVPTDATKVYGVVSRAGTGTDATVTTGSFPPDLTIIRGRDAGYSWRWGDRLRGTPRVLRSNLTNAELTSESDLSSFNMNGFSLTGTGASLSNSSGVNYINYAMGRAPSFFDEVCYTGTGVARTVTHNLGVAPELLIVKARSQSGGSWNTWTTGFTISVSSNQYVMLNTNDAKDDKNTSEFWGSSYPTASVFGLGDNFYMNNSGATYVAYLFATCPGVSKVGSYTGTGTTQIINCGFTAGSRFVLIKRTDSTGDWYVWDSARGIIPSNDPYLLLNSTAAEVTGTDYVDTSTTGFEISSTAPAAINAAGGTFIFLAIA
jgi:hypothetical protein